MSIRPSLLLALAAALVLFGLSGCGTEHCKVGYTIREGACPKPDCGPVPTTACPRDPRATFQDQWVCEGYENQDGTSADRWVCE